MIWMFEPERGGKGSPCEFVGTTAALIGLAIAGGVTSVVSSKMASNASHDAAQIQQTAAQKDLSLRQTVFNTQQQNMAPYRAIGLQGLAGASNLASQPPSMDPSGNGWSTLHNANAGPAGVPPVPNYSSFMNQPPPQGASAPAPAPTGTSQRVMPAGTTPTGTAIPRGTATLGNLGRMVTMRSPNGATKQVPASQQAHYEALGATVVG
jgi:hypothetical protein